MEELLPEMCTLEDSEPEAKQCFRRVPSTYSPGWHVCEHSRGHSLDMIPDLIAYMGTIIRANREEWNQWLRYNMLFLTSIDVLPSKNQALCKYCTLASKLKHC